ncbi:Histone-lysine N-methyltransferase ASHR1, partial [Fusarium oxysporum f. sp. conglutinans]
MPRMNLGLPYNHCSHSPCPAGFQSSNLLRCGACQTVKYCGKPHQKADRPRHKVQCVPIKQTKDKLTEEELKLRANPGD